MLVVQRSGLGGDQDLAKKKGMGLKRNEHLNFFFFYSFFFFAIYLRWSTLASFSDPAQLSVTFSTEKWERAWYLFSRE